MCSTTIAGIAFQHYSIEHLARELHRHSIGIDFYVSACRVIGKRLCDHFDVLWSEIEF